MHEDLLLVLPVKIQVTDLGVFAKKSPKHFSGQIRLCPIDSPPYIGSYRSFVSLHMQTKYLFCVHLDAQKHRCNEKHANFQTLTLYIF